LKTEPNPASAKDLALDKVCHGVII
jgi:hypothetical protein